MIAWWWLVPAGLFCGFCGVVVACMCAAAGRADDEMDRIHDQFPEEGHF